MTTKERRIVSYPSENFAKIIIAKAHENGENISTTARSIFAQHINGMPKQERDRLIKVADQILANKKK